MNETEICVVLGATSLAETLRSKFSKDKWPAVDKVVTESMREVKANPDKYVWMTAATDDALFRCAVGALLLIYKDDDSIRERIESELDVIKTMSAAASGIPVNFVALFNEDRPEPLGLIKAFEAARSTDGDKT